MTFYKCVVTNKFTSNIDFESEIEHTDSSKAIYEQRELYKVFLPNKYNINIVRYNVQSKDK